MAYEHEQTRRRGSGRWTRTHWLVLAGVVVAIAVVVLLFVVPMGGGGSGGGGGGSWG